jgi:hypothetical protein
MATRSETFARLRASKVFRRRSEDVLFVTRHGVEKVLCKPCAVLALKVVLNCFADRRWALKGKVSANKYP